MKSEISLLTTIVEINNILNNIKSKNPIQKAINNICSESFDSLCTNKGALSKSKKEVLLLLLLSGARLNTVKASKVNSFNSEDLNVFNKIMILQSNNNIRRIAEKINFQTFEELTNIDDKSALFLLTRNEFFNSQNFSKLRTLKSHFEIERRTSQQPSAPIYFKNRDVIKLKATKFINTIKKHTQSKNQDLFEILIELLTELSNKKINPNTFLIRSAYINFLIDIFCSNSFLNLKSRGKSAIFSFLKSISPNTLVYTKLDILFRYDDDKLFFEKGINTLSQCDNLIELINNITDPIVRLFILSNGHKEVLENIPQQELVKNKNIKLLQLLAPHFNTIIINLTSSVFKQLLTLKDNEVLIFVDLLSESYEYIHILNKLGGYSRIILEIQNKILPLGGIRYLGFKSEDLLKLKIKLAEEIQIPHESGYKISYSSKKFNDFIVKLNAIFSKIPFPQNVKDSFKEFVLEKNFSNLNESLLNKIFTFIELSNNNQNSKKHLDEYIIKGIFKEIIKVYTANEFEYLFEKDKLFQKINNIIIVNNFVFDRRLETLFIDTIAGKKIDLFSNELNTPKYFSTKNNKTLLFDSIYELLIEDNFSDSQYIFKMYIEEPNLSTEDFAYKDLVDINISLKKIEYEVLENFKSLVSSEDKTKQEVINNLSEKLESLETMLEKINNGILQILFSNNYQGRLYTKVLFLKTELIELINKMKLFTLILTQQKGNEIYNLHTKFKNELDELLKEINKAIELMTLTKNSFVKEFVSNFKSKELNSEHILLFLNNLENLHEKKSLILSSFQDIKRYVDDANIQGNINSKISDIDNKISNLNKYGHSFSSSIGDYEAIKQVVYNNNPNSKLRERINSIKETNQEIGFLKDFANKIKYVKSNSNISINNLLFNIEKLYRNTHLYFLHKIDYTNYQSVLSFINNRIKNVGDVVHLQLPYFIPLQEDILSVLDVNLSIEKRSSSEIYLNIILGNSDFDNSLIQFNQNTLRFTEKSILLNNLTNIIFEYSFNDNNEISSFIYNAVFKNEYEKDFDNKYIIDSQKNIYFDFPNIISNLKLNKDISGQKYFQGYITFLHNNDENKNHQGLLLFSKNKLENIKAKVSNIKNIIDEEDMGELLVEELSNALLITASELEEKLEFFDEFEISNLSSFAQTIEIIMSTYQVVNENIEIEMYFEDNISTIMDLEADSIYINIHINKDETDIIFELEAPPRLAESNGKLIYNLTTEGLSEYYYPSSDFEISFNINNLTFSFSKINFAFEYENGEIFNDLLLNIQNLNRSEYLLINQFADIFPDLPEDVNYLDIQLILKNNFNDLLIEALNEVQTLEELLNYKDKKGNKFLLNLLNYSFVESQYNYF